MSSILDIENKLREVAKSSNLKGDAVELLIKLISYSQYEAETTTRLALLESLPDTAVHENSKIKHAMDQMYSAFRGVNPSLEVKVLITGTLTLTRLQEVYSDKRNTFHYSHAILPSGEVVTGDYTFSHGVEYTLILYKAPSLEEEILTVDEENVLLMETLSSNISEIYELKDISLESPGVSVAPIATTKIFGDHIDSSESSDPKVLDLTSVDWGIRFYAPDSTGFSSSTSYRLSYLPFTSAEIDDSQLFKLKIEGTQIDTSSLVLTPSVDKDNLENLVYNLRSSMISQSRVRSNTDVVDIFKSKFSHKIKDASIREYIHATDTLILNYIPNDSEIISGTSVHQINSLELSEYKSSLLHYVTDDIQLEILFDVDNAVRISLSVEIIIDASFDTSNLISYVSTYDYILGKSFNYNEVVGAINNLEGVRYAVVTATDLRTSEIVLGEVVLNSDEYFILSDSLTYSYKQ